MDRFLSMCEIHLIENDDVMVRMFLQTLLGPYYEWYMSLASYEENLSMARGKPQQTKMTAKIKSNLKYYI
jgi:hypothetical protein